VVYRLIGKYVEVIEIIGVGKRDKEEIYKLMEKRLKKLKKSP
jgi:mRNA interferase RelE/StbE